MPEVVVLDYGSGNVRSAVRALEHVGASVHLTADPAMVASCDGLFVPGVGNFHASLAGLRAVDAPRLIDIRLSGGRPVLGICVGMQALFDGSTEPSDTTQDGLGEWPGLVDRLPAAVVPHMGWNTVTPPSGSRRGRTVLLRALVCRALLESPRRRRFHGQPGTPGHHLRLRDDIRGRGRERPAQRDAVPSREVR